jgi:hypothetical protein
MTKTTTSSLVAAGFLAAMSLGSTAVAAPASHGGNAVRASGGCSSSAVWKLKAKPDNGALEVEFEVDSNANGQVWKVRLKDNGDRFFAGKRTTAGPSGSFSVQQSTANRGGNDVIRARAVHGDEICRGTLTV